MNIDQEQLASLVERAHETLSVEVKRWIDPSSPDGTAKIAKACIAMRNNNGGFLVIGFDNDTGQPDYDNVPQNVRKVFHADKIQYIVTKYASDPFEAEVYFKERDEQEYPIIYISDGVKTPVSAKSGLKGEDNKVLIRENGVYVRSLSSNNTVSTTLARTKDWSRLTGICFDNREADIGRFVRRHLSGLDAKKLKDAFEVMASGQSKQEYENTIGANGTTIIRERRADYRADRLNNNEEVIGFLEQSANRLDDLLAKRNPPISLHGSWEVAFTINGELHDFETNESFLNLISASNPKYSGWPLWVDSRGFKIESAEPRVFDNAWEAFIDSSSIVALKYIDYWRIKPDVHFYHWRSLKDDLSRGPDYPKAGAALDFLLATMIVAEALAMGVEFGKAISKELTKCQLSYCFRWKGLKNRELCSWADRSRHIRPGYIAYQDELTYCVRLSLDTPNSVLFQKVHEVTKKLFEIFKGFQLAIDVTEEITAKVLNRGG